MTVISSAKQAADLLSGAAKNNADDVRAAVLKVLAGLESAEPPLAELFQIAETVRSSVDYVVFDYRASYADRALPFGEQEARRFGNAMGLLDHLEALYRRALDAASTAPPGEATTAYQALALQRCMACVMGRMVEHYRARQTVEAVLWNRLQRHMRAATTAKLEGARVADPMDPRGKVSPKGIYSQALLLSIAQVGAMAQRILEASVALSAMFADLVEVTLLDADPAKAPTQPQAPADGVGIKRTGRIRVVEAGGVTHLLNTTKVDAAIATVLQRLSEGRSPEELGLASVGKADFGSLLPRLRRIWCGTGEIRETQRVVVEKAATLTVGFIGIASFADPETLTPPPQFEIWDYHKHAGQQAASSDVVVEKDREVPPENWHVNDHSATGMRGRRRGGGARLRRHQLMGMAFLDAERRRQFTLGEFRWLQQHPDPKGDISAGVRFLSNAASVALIRIHGLQKGQYQTVGPAFLFEEEGLTRVVLPYGWFAPKRNADFWHGGAVVPVTLTDLRSRGADFEIGTYVPRTE